MAESYPSVKITDVEWVRDHQHRAGLRLRLDGQPAHILSRQQRELTRRGIVSGLVFLVSERRDQAPDRFIRGEIAPGLTAADLVGCTNDPRVFALYEEMCHAIAADTWHAGPRPALSGYVSGG